MIGDWVIMNNSPHQLDAGDLKNIFANLENDGKDDARYLSPIPLTSEILKKNGFKDGQFFAELYIQGWHIISDAHNLCMECERGWHMNIQCRCVHELQHALKLCGINKEISL